MALNFTLMPKYNAQQYLRIQRLFIGTRSYLLISIQALVCWWLGFLPGSVFWVYFPMIIAVNLVFYLMIRSGFNLRFADPSMTFPQLAIGVPTVFYLMYYAQNARVILMLMLLPIFLFGLFQFRSRDFYLLSVLTLCEYAILISLLAYYRPQELNLRLELMLWASFFFVMLQMSSLGGYMAHLRHKVLEKNRELGKRNLDLTERTDELQRAHQEVASALETLRLTHEELARKEKLAALGALVAGVAHEINTPIGNGVMAASMLDDETRQFRQQFFGENGMQRAMLEQYLDDAGHACDVLLRNLKRAADLVTSFKQVAIDQSSSQRRMFLLSEISSEIILILSPTFRQSLFAINQNISVQLALDSYPGPLGQVITNLLNNAVLHAFEGRDHGTISIEATAHDNDWVDLIIKDDGIGIQPANLPLIFDPFFTTKFGTGGSGLGLNITHNIVTGMLGGRIRVHSEIGIGTRFIITLPVIAPHPAQMQDEQDMQNMH
jgi:signal transduction histidine kinase